MTTKKEKLTQILERRREISKTRNKGVEYKRTENILGRTRNLMAEHLGMTGAILVTERLEEWPLLEDLLDNCQYEFGIELDLEAKPQTVGALVRLIRTAVHEQPKPAWSYI